MNTIHCNQIPNRVLDVCNVLLQNSYTAYPVGGCVRDSLLGRTPNDWDITTNAHPEDIVRIFEKAGEKVVYENNFGTVAVIDEEANIYGITRTIEITPYRTESAYSDNRHPDEVRWAQTLEEDLVRRDFTVNALALDVGKCCETRRETLVSQGFHKDTQISQATVIDHVGGVQDCTQGILKAVGNPHQRFEEDALRILRLIRFGSQLGFGIDPKTLQAAMDHRDRIQHISMERIRDEFFKIMMSNNVQDGIEMMRHVGIIQHVLPELFEGYKIDQNRSHTYDVWTHNIRAGQNAADQNWPLHIRLAALFHDIGKPKTKRFDKAQQEYTFYGHEVVGAGMTNTIMKRFKVSKELKNKVVTLVRYHMFFSDPDKITLSAVRRMIRNVGKDLIWDLMKVRRADRIGMGRPKAAPYRLRKYESMIDEALRDPISVGMLKIDGDILQKKFQMKPGKKIGWILYALLNEVLDDPTKNTEEYLEQKVIQLLQINEQELQQLANEGRQTQSEQEQIELARIRKKHKVRTTESNQK